MELSADLQKYKDNNHSPWGELYYDIIFSQLEFVSGKKVLDFGSGFGLVAAELGKRNTVTAVEPEALMCEHREGENFTQICGDITALAELADGSFDVIICHNVLEYVKEREELAREFARLLKSGGVLSVVKHNHAGRIMQKVVFENNIEQALGLLRGEEIEVKNFGAVGYYAKEDIPTWAEELVIDKVYGVRTFFALQRNDLKFEEGWKDELFKVETAVSELEPYRGIAFFHHVLYKKL